MKLIVGLGNPGEKYKNNRHNSGFIIIDRIASESGGVWNFESRFNAEVCKLNNTLLIKPHTFVNNSGEAVSQIVNFYRIDLNDLTVIHDDVDMEFGAVRLKKGMGSGGHHGVENIIEKLGTKEFWRLKIGVGRPDPPLAYDVEDWVLTDFTPDELAKLAGLTFPQVRPPAIPHLPQSFRAQARNLAKRLIDSH